MFADDTPQSFFNQRLHCRPMIGGELFGFI
jgi:hypothetical protein